VSGKQHYEIHVQTHFSAAHHLRGYEGDCSKPHGHNWTVDAYVECTALNDIDIGIDFRDIKSVLAEAVRPLDHEDLNTLPTFADKNPSSEKLAQYVFRALRTRLRRMGAMLTKVAISEGAGCAVTYWEDCSSRNVADSASPDD